MASRAIDSDLLWRALVWVMYQYANLTPDEQNERPQRPYQQHDGKVLAWLIRSIRSRYHAAKCEYGQAVDFQQCMDEAFSHWKSTRPGWTKPEAKFYSSVVGTYFAWTKNGIPEEAGTPFDPILTLATYALRSKPPTLPPFQ